LRQTARLKPDVVLLEPNTPDCDGLELIKALRTRLPSSLLVVFSAKADPFTSRTLSEREPTATS
jgi:DNA-binding NarL/FixJ family response regulator